VAADLTQSAAESSEPGSLAKPAGVPPVAVGERRHQGRFAFVYVGLVLVLGGAIAGLAILLTRPGHQTPPPWSSWKPVGNDPDLVTRQIAQHVSGEYRFTDRKAIVGIHGGPPIFTVPEATPVKLPVVAVELRGQASVKGSIVVNRTDRAWEYELCGGGNACSIAKGKPSTTRGALLHREAVELALYTFKYVPEVDSVIALLPPKPPVTQDTPQYAVYLRRSELKRELDRPLRMTMPQTPPLKLVAQPLPTTAVDTLASSKVYRWQPQQLQTGAVLLVLDPVP
jgi:hypothetical protein